MMKMAATTSVGRIDSFKIMHSVSLLLKVAMRFVRLMNRVISKDWTRAALKRMWNVSWRLSARLRRRQYESLTFDVERNIWVWSRNNFYTSGIHSSSQNVGHSPYVLVCRTNDQLEDKHSLFFSFEYSYSNAKQNERCCWKIRNRWHWLVVVPTAKLLLFVRQRSIARNLLAASC